MIAKTFFLAKIIHRIGTRSIRQEKSLLESQAENRAFFVLRAAWPGGRSSAPAESAITAHGIVGMREWAAA
jgi:hypothetical protein